MNCKTYLLRQIISADVEGWGIFSFFSFGLEVDAEVAGLGVLVVASSEGLLLL